MNEHPHHPDRDWLQRQHPIVRLVMIVLPGLVSAVLGVGAAGGAKDRADTVKDKAEAGYQVTRETLQDLRDQVAGLDAELAQLRRSLRAGAGKKTTKATLPPAEPPAAPPPPPPAALPSTLDQAAAQLEPNRKKEP
jgi:hypothetical protein